ncbi:PREDICTED: zinc finger CCCH domain-containing protein 13 isoform X2 [Erythranthe guttata]|uniref:zinc finger CCCH domain-containing protein 13 isoform X2 n=1 Tax=Erythranthe guttata TaxID=4155 RepID=UPI00064D7611|nr:PREDICTED: zinc finger CCCH domain-containing protein 13 isoform X2 [Erythranthe guttata]|eukprot:XP_012852467.1 PREDICTED: zinc finger CCCH domain-containing protein 13 isoform X2 [Erythranthe guttata]
MVERELYKTKLCMLYERGRCPRQFCNFAHGTAELRRSFNGREEYREGRDLRERLDRMRSPLDNSPGRGDAKARHSSRGDSPRSVGKRIERNHRKRRQLDGHNNDYSGRMSDGTEDKIKDRRHISSDTKVRADEQLRELHSEIKMLESDRRRMEMYLEDKVKQADNFTMKIHELEMQLSKEKEEGKRLTTKIKKFVKAHSRHLRLQDELKRSHAHFQKLGEQLASDAVGPGNEEINTMSDDVAGGYASPLNEGQLNAAPPKKRSRVFMGAHDSSNQVGRSRVDKLSRHSGNHDKFSNSKKPEADGDAATATADKYKVSEAGLPKPPTGIAANAIDEDVEVVETDNNKFQVVGAETEVALRTTPRLPFPPPPPPPIPHNYKGDDDDENEETVEVDIV